MGYYHTMLPSSPVTGLSSLNQISAPPISSAFPPNINCCRSLSPAWVPSHPQVSDPWWHLSNPRLTGACLNHICAWAGTFPATKKRSNPKHEGRSESRGSEITLHIDWTSYVCSQPRKLVPSLLINGSPLWNHHQLQNINDTVVGYHFLIISVWGHRYCLEIRLFCLISGWKLEPESRKCRIVWRIWCLTFRKTFSQSTFVQSKWRMLLNTLLTRRFRCSFLNLSCHLSVSATEYSVILFSFSFIFF